MSSERHIFIITGKRQEAKVLATLKQRIEDQGWMMLSAADPHNPSHLFLYTVGLTALGTPELAITNLPKQTLEKGLYLLGMFAQRTIKNPLELDNIVELTLNNGMRLLLQTQSLPAGYRLDWAHRLYGDQVRAIVLRPSQSRA